MANNSNLDNTRQICRELIQNTESGKIKWRNTYENDDRLDFVYKKEVTKKKFLKFELIIKREKYNSKLNITFGPITKKLPGVSKSTITLSETVGEIQPKNQPMMYDLIDCISRKFNAGDIKYLKESKVNEFFSGNDAEIGARADKLKDYKLLNLMTKDTNDGKLMWEDTFHDRTVATFSCHFALTKLKKLVFTLRCNTESEIKEDNIFRVILKTTTPKGGSESSRIKALSLKDYPSLLPLIKVLCKKYLGRDFESPFTQERKKKIQTELLTADNIEQYKVYALDIIREIIRKLPSTLDWGDRFEPIYDAYEKVKTATTFEEINDLMYFAHQESERKNPIGTPRWSK